MNGLAGRALDLYRAVVLRTSDPDQQLLMLTTWANRVGASTKDVEAARAFLLRDHRECRG